VNGISPTGDIQRTVTLHRRRGDALTRAGRDDEANQAYEKALRVIDGAMADPSVMEEAAVDPVKAADVADLLGVRGGLLRRLGRLDKALESYQAGAEIETRHNLPVTYNRANAAKVALISGNRSLGQLHEELVALGEALERRLSTDERAADDAWLWADLGDVRLLLDDEDGAVAAYRTFGAKARTDSPTSALAVLRQIANALAAHGDVAADRIAKGARRIENLLRVG
jgi:tetratricopeptide (TPR) repeat protein